MNVYQYDPPDMTGHILLVNSNGHIGLGAASAIAGHIIG